MDTVFAEPYDAPVKEYMPQDVIIDIITATIAAMRILIVFIL